MDNNEFDKKNTYQTAVGRFKEAEQNLKDGAMVVFL